MNCIHCQKEMECIKEDILRKINGLKGIFKFYECFLCGMQDYIEK